MSGGGPAEDEGERLRRVTSRAIRRLDLLEYLILGAAALLALLAGGLVAFVVAAETTLPLRGTWIVASILFFVVPAGLARWSERRAEGGSDGSTGETTNDT